MLLYNNNHNVRLYMYIIIYHSSFLTYILKFLIFNGIKLNYSPIMVSSVFTSDNPAIALVNTVASFKDKTCKT